MLFMRFGSPESRRAEEFDAFRRELVMRSKTVSGEQRDVWFERLKELIEAMFPESGAHFRKPGLATRMFSAEVPLPGSDKMHLLDLAQELDDNWKSMHRDEVKGGASCVYVDRMDGIWEWALDLGGTFVTGHVKLRNFVFDKDGPKSDRPGYERKRHAPGDGDAPPRRRSFEQGEGGFDRNRRFGGGNEGYAPKRNYPPGGYSPRPEGGDRPYRRPPGDNPESGPRPFGTPFKRKGPPSGGKGGPKRFGPKKPPRRKPSD